MTNTLCSVKNCNNEKYTASRSALCRAHRNEQQKAWYRSKPGYKAEENLRYFKRNEGRTYLNGGSGYVLYMGTEHPATNPSGLTPYHRIILWDKLNGENVPCAECGGQLVWFAKTPELELCVDHVDGDRSNNHPDNLDPVHLACNTRRAHAMRARIKAAESAA